MSSAAPDSPPPATCIDLSTAAMHASDQPIETLASLALNRGISLLTPMLGQPVEPARVQRLTPWWCSAATAERTGAAMDSEQATFDDESAVSWPVD